MLETHTDTAGSGFAPVDVNCPIVSFLFRKTAFASVVSKSYQNRKTALTMKETSNVKLTQRKLNEQFIIDRV